MGFERIVVDPDVLGGQPCIAASRTPVARIVELVAGGATLLDIVRAHPELDLQDVSEALYFASEGAMEGTWPLRPEG